MSKTKSKILLSIFLITVLISSCCFATDVSTPIENSIIENTVTTEQESTTSTNEDWVKSDLYVANDSVTISSIVDGNAFVAAKEVTVTGEIGGDLFVVAEKLNIEGGYIYSSIFACAKEITVNGVVYDLYAACENLTLGTNGFVYRDMKVTASTVNMNGKVRRDAYISSKDINFASDAGTIIYGNLNYSSDEAEFTAPEGVVTGTTTYTVENSANENSSISIGSIILSYVKDALETLLLTFVIVMILIWLAPKFVEKVTSMGVKKSFVSLGIGFATPIAFLIVAILLILTKIGVILFVPALMILIFIGFIGNSIASIFFGKLFAKLLKLEGNVKFVLLTLASALVIWIISQIPFIGGVFAFLIWLFGFGTALVNIFYKGKSNKVEKETKKEVKE